MSKSQIDYSRLTEWAKSVYPQKWVTVDSKKNDHDRLQSEYPWNLAYGRHNGIWQNDFEKLFPELAEYCYKSFGLQEHHIYGIVFLPTRDHFINKHFWHIDPDAYGLRFYLNNNSIETNHLLMREIKSSAEDINWKTDASLLEAGLCDEIINCKILSATSLSF